METIGPVSRLRKQGAAYTILTSNTVTGRERSAVAAHTVRCCTCLSACCQVRQTQQAAVGWPWYPRRRKSSSMYCTAGVDKWVRITYAVL